MSSGGNGSILFVREGTLLALTFDERSLTTLGEAIPVLQNVGQGPNDPQYWLFTAMVIAYTSDQSGEFEVYVRPFDPDDPGRAVPGTAVVQVSTDGGQVARWRPDGREIFYVSDGKMMAANVETQPTLKIGSQTVLFPIPIGIVGSSWTISPDGQRFLFPLGAAMTPPITFVLNWQATVKR